MTVAPAPFRRRHSPHRLRLALLGAIGIALVAVGIVALVRYGGGTQESSTPSAAQGSGVAATQSRAVASFDGVELAGANNVTIRVGAKQSVVVRGDANLLRRVTTEVRSGVLVIGNKGSFATNRPMRVDVSIPAIDSLALSGSGVVSVEGIDADRLDLALSGSGVVRASGTAGRLDVTLGGSGDAQLQQLQARDVHAVVSGSGRILVTATRSLDASIPGSGTIVYGGTPSRVTTDVTGSGAVAPR